jgi:hypothetical protein
MDVASSAPIGDPPDAITAGAYPPAALQRAIDMAEHMFHPRLRFPDHQIPGPHVSNAGAIFHYFPRDGREYICAGIRAEVEAEMLLRRGGLPVPWVVGVEKPG